MGQKVHPYGFRLGVIKTWNSKWFEERNYTSWLHEDITLKRVVQEHLSNAGISAIEIERAAAASRWSAPATASASMCTPPAPAS
jgi:small subunit ribosomal protein S3